MGGVRTNIIPRDGGNTFKGSSFGAYTNNSLQGEQSDRPAEVALGATVDQQCGLRSTTSIQRIGGPIKKDTLWFYCSRAAVFKPDSSRLGCSTTRAPPPYLHAQTSASRPTKRPSTGNVSLRLTWQASPRNKFASRISPRAQIFDHYYAGNATNRPTRRLFPYGAGVFHAGQLDARRSRAGCCSKPVRRSATRTTSGPAAGQRSERVRLYRAQHRLELGQSRADHWATREPQHQHPVRGVVRHRFARRQVRLDLPALLVPLGAVT